MLTAEATTAELKAQIKADLDRFDADRIREIYDFIAQQALKRVSDIADEAWEKDNLSLEKLDQVITDYRASKHQ